MYFLRYGQLIQLKVEYFIYTEKVNGSSPLLLNLNI